MEFCSNKDPISLPKSDGTKRDASRVGLGISFYEAIGYGQGRLSTSQWAAEMMDNGIV